MGAGVRDRTARGAASMVGALVAVILMLVALVPAPAAARAEQVPPVDPYAPYEAQDECDPTPKPGVVAFAKLLLEAYPVSGWSGISRDCGVRGRSEHKEGRAFDWAVSVSNPQQRAAADDALAKLLATDEDGNRHALFRRFGLMYMIWNRQIFSASQPEAGWRPYACNSGASYDDCHVNHVHFSFSTPGAEMRTSWWQMRPEPERAPAIERVAAARRAGMAVEISRAAFPSRGSTDKVFLASAANPHDAIVASVMAGAAHGAVLLTRATDELEPRVDRELERVLSSDGTITVVGDRDAVPDEVLTAHVDDHDVRRIAGRDAPATARLAALDMERIGRSQTAVVASVDALGDALPLVAVAAANDWPVLFTDGEQLSSDARAFLVEAEIRQVHIAGSRDAVSADVRAAIAVLDDVRIKRHDSTWQAGTSVAVAEHFFALPSAYAIVNADDPAVGAVAAAYAGERRHAPVIAIEGRVLSGAVTDYIVSSSSPDTSAILVGDTELVGRQVERQLARILR